MWMQVGGNIAQINLMKAVQTLRPVEAVTYQPAAHGYRELPDVLDEDQTFELVGPDGIIGINEVGGRAAVMRRK
jgi:hypothetical protein